MIPLGGLALANVQSVLFLGAHPDDIELGCGATTLTLVRRRPDLQVRWVVMSGSTDRRREAHESAAGLLAGLADADVIVHDFPDRYFPAQYRGVKEAIVAAGHDFDPDLIFTHQRDDLHQDHRLVAELTLHAFRDHTILGYEIPKYDGDMGRPNVYVDVTRDAVEVKAVHLMKHFVSQRDRGWFDEDAFRAIMRLRGIECHATEGFAEAFYGNKLRLL